MNPSIVSPPVGHVAMGSLGCESCHVDSGGNSSLTLPVQDGAKFSNSAFSHNGITAGCASCHGGTSTIYGVTVKTMSGLNPQHVPTTGACENCHINSVPPSLIPLTGASGGMTTFGNAQFSHNGISSGCSTCHGANASSFYGISSIVLQP
ncbi:MAG: cytochrome c3 family protein, partial [Burkholderiales bacterium]